MTALVTRPPTRLLFDDVVQGALVTDPVTARTLRVGMTMVGVLVLGLGTLAATVPIQGAVIAPGEIDMESRVKAVSHPTGGVVSAILVHNGDRVRRGQVLARLDDRVSGAQSRYLGASVDQLLAAEARLVAERDGAAGIAFPAELTARGADPQVAAIIDGERRSFAAHRASLASQQVELAQQARQARADRDAMTAKQQVLGQQGVIIDRELSMVRKLYEKRYTTLERLGALERGALDIQSSAKTTGASAVQAGARLAEIAARGTSLTDQARATSANELAEVQARLSDLRRQKVTADDSFDRSVVRAPADGVVDKLVLTSIGGTVPAGEPMMQIVPDRDAQVVRARIPVDDVDQVAAGRAVHIRFSALDSRTVPELDGTVALVDANRTVDQRTGAAYYGATIRIAPGEGRKLDGVAVRPGMSVETFITSSNRTLMGLILRPLSNQLRRAFRHD
jgi:HlyD family secretion protein